MAPELAFEKAGIQTKGQGIAFTLPVEDVVGLNLEHYEDDKKKAKDEKSEEKK